MANRRFFVIGNWKMNCTFDKVNTNLKFLNAGHLNEGTEVVIAPSSPYIHYVKQNLKAPNVEMALQNCYTQNSGSFTGEISAEMGADVGCRWIILGHPERRTKFGEQDDVIGQKVKHVLATTQLNIIACVCDVTEDRQRNETMKICARQLKAIAENVNDWSRMVIAYEALWTLDTGEPATPDEAQDIVSGIRKWLEENVNKEVADSTRILYAGYVSASNCVELSRKPDIDGFLVGGASLKPEFVDIVNAASIADAA